MVQVLFQFAQGFLDAANGLHDVFIASGVTHAEAVWITKCITSYGCHVCLLQEIHGEVGRVVDGDSAIALAKVAVALREEIEGSLWYVDLQAWYFLGELHDQVATTLECLAHSLHCALVECVCCLCCLLAY